MRREVEDVQWVCVRVVDRNFAFADLEKAMAPRGWEKEGIAEQTKTGCGCCEDGLCLVFADV